MLVLKSFDPLKIYDLTLGRETSFGLGNGIIIAKPFSEFVCIWFNAYRDYNPFRWNWAYYSVQFPNLLAKAMPGSIHIEESSLQKPAYNEPHKLFTHGYDWSNNYAIHVWKRRGRVPDRPEELQGLNTTLGEVMRYIMYGMKSRLAFNPS